MIAGIWALIGFFIGFFVGRYQKELALITKRLKKDLNVKR